MLYHGGTRSISAVLVIKFCALLLWCYALVLTVEWFRAVGSKDRKTHVGHFLGLMGVLVPLSCALVMFAFAGAFMGLPSVIALLVILVPAGLVVGLQLEIRKLRETSEEVEMLRLGITLGLTGLVLLWRGDI